MVYPEPTLYPVSGIEALAGQMSDTADYSNKEAQRRADLLAKQLGLAASATSNEAARQNIDINRRADAFHELMRPLQYREAQRTEQEAQLTAGARTGQELNPVQKAAQKWHMLEQAYTTRNPGLLTSSNFTPEEIAAHTEKINDPDVGLAMSRLFNGEDIADLPPNLQSAASRAMQGQHGWSLGVAMQNAAARRDAAQTRADATTGAATITGASREKVGAGHDTARVDSATITTGGRIDVANIRSAGQLANTMAQIQGRADALRQSRATMSPRDFMAATKGLIAEMQGLQRLNVPGITETFGPILQSQMASLLGANQTITPNAPSPQSYAAADSALTSISSFAAAVRQHYGAQPAAPPQATPASPLAAPTGPAAGAVAAQENVPPLGPLQTAGGIPDNQLPRGVQSAMGREPTTSPAASPPFTALAPQADSAADRARQIQAQKDRGRLINAIANTRLAGYPVTAGIGTPTEETGDRAASKDIEQLIGALGKWETNARAAGNVKQAEGVKKEREYWEKDLRDFGMTAAESTTANEGSTSVKGSGYGPYMGSDAQRGGLSGIMDTYGMKLPPGMSAGMSPVTGQNAPTPALTPNAMNSSELTAYMAAIPKGRAASATGPAMVGNYNVQNAIQPLDSRIAFNAQMGLGSHDPVQITYPLTAERARGMPGVETPGNKMPPKETAFSKSQTEGTALVKDAYLAMGKPDTPPAVMADFDQRLRMAGLGGLSALPPLPTNKAEAPPAQGPSMASSLNKAAADKKSASDALTQAKSAAASAKIDAQNKTHGLSLGLNSAKMSAAHGKTKGQIVTAFLTTYRAVAGREWVGPLPAMPEPTMAQKMMGAMKPTGAQLPEDVTPVETTLGAVRG